MLPTISTPCMTARRSPAGSRPRPRRSALPPKPAGPNGRRGSPRRRPLPRRIAITNTALRTQILTRACWPTTMKALTRAACADSSRRPTRCRRATSMPATVRPSTTCRPTTRRFTTSWSWATRCGWNPSTSPRCSDRGAR